MSSVPITEPATPPQEPIPDRPSSIAPDEIDVLLERLPRRWYTSPDPEVAARQVDESPLDYSLVTLVAMRAHRSPDVLRAMLACALPEFRALVDEVVAEYAAKPEPRRWALAELAALDDGQLPAPDDQVEIEAGVFRRWLGSANQVLALRRLRPDPAIAAWQARLDAGGREELESVLDRLPKAPLAHVPFVTVYAACRGDHELEVRETGPSPAAAIRAVFEDVLTLHATAADCADMHGPPPEVDDLGAWLLDMYGDLRVVKLRLPPAAVGHLRDTACHLGGGAE